MPSTCIIVGLQQRSITEVSCTWQDCALISPVFASCARTFETNTSNCNTAHSTLTTSSGSGGDCRYKE